MTKYRQKLNENICEIDRSHLCILQVWGMKLIPLSVTEILKVALKTREVTFKQSEVNLFLARFSDLEPLSWSDAKVGSANLPTH